jgi:hypothetical protein
MGAPAGSGTPRCGERDRGAPASVDAATSTHTSSSTSNRIHKLYERVVASYLKNAHLEEGISGGPG